MRCSMRDSDAADRAETFAFRLSLDADSAFPYVCGAVTGSIADGDTFLLRHGEALVIRDLPAGVAYDVTETDSRGLISTASNAAGRTCGDTEVRFLNVRRVAGPGSPPATGESSPPPWAALLLLSGAGAGLVLAARRRRAPRE